jgi:hypothetical protein
MTSIVCATFLCVSTIHRPLDGVELPNVRAGRQHAQHETRGNVKLGLVAGNKALYRKLLLSPAVDTPCSWLGRAGAVPGRLRSEPGVAPLPPVPAPFGVGVRPAALAALVSPLSSGAKPSSVQSPLPACILYPQGCKEGC